MHSYEHKLSPSTLNLYSDCPRCFWLKVNKGISRPSGPFPSLPGGFDTKIKNYFDRLRLSGEIPDPLQNYEKDVSMFKDQKFLSKARSWDKKPKYIEDGNFVLRGGVDDLLYFQDDIVILDYKTKGYEPKQDAEVSEYYQRQLNLYNLIFEKAGYATADFGLLLYVYPEEFSSSTSLELGVEIKEVEKDIESAERLVREASATLDSRVPDHSENCEYHNWNPLND